MHFGTGTGKNNEIVFLLFGTETGIIRKLPRKLGRYKETKKSFLLFGNGNSRRCQEREFPFMPGPSVIIYFVVALQPAQDENPPVSILKVHYTAASGSQNASFLHQLARPSLQIIHHYHP